MSRRHFHEYSRWVSVLLVLSFLAGFMSNPNLIADAKGNQPDSEGIAFSLVQFSDQQGDLINDEFFNTAFQPSATNISYALADTKTWLIEIPTQNNQDNWISSTQAITSTQNQFDVGDAISTTVPSNLVIPQGIPSGFYSIASDTGVALYRKDYSGGQPDFVQVISLNQGATVRLLNGAIVDQGLGVGPFGGNNPTFRRQSLQDAWNGLSAANTGAFCIVNGQFFSTNSDPTPLAFPLKKDGIIVSDGYGSLREFQGQLLMLEIWNDRADIRTLSKDALYQSSAPNILGGLDEKADKGVYTYTGRTFVGIDDADNDGKYEKIYIFSSKYARQVDAASALRSFGADKVIMFDGGSSTQLLCKNSTYIASSRTIPQTIGVIKGSNQAPCPTITAWKGQYWNNRYLSGNPVLCRNDGSVNFDWGGGGPGSGVPADNFSARWTRQLSFNAGEYTFIARADDGIRVWLDSSLIIDAWRDQGPTEYRAKRNVSAGNHTIKVEYYENGGGAVAQLRWERTSITCPNQYKAEYYNNRYLSGSPVLTRCEAWPINQNWGSGGPGNGLPNDNFSVRWTGQAYIAAGTYTIIAKADDGIRAWIGSDQVINAWRDQAPTEYRATRTLSGGTYNIKVEYYENGGGAVAQFRWDAQSGVPAGYTFCANENQRCTFSGTMDVAYGAQGKFNYKYGIVGGIDCNNNTFGDPISGVVKACYIKASPQNSCPTITAWKGQYWNNRYLSGNPVLCRNDGSVNFDWGGGGPGSGVPVDNFSARWERTQYFDAATYRFHLKGDDGIRLWVDGLLAIDQWKDQSFTEYTRDLSLSAGNHSLKVEYYENGGGAAVKLWWDKLTTSGSGNLAKGKPAYAWSQESASYPPAKGNDGNYLTRWSSRISATLGDQWWWVDLGSRQTFDRVIICWEAAYAARHYVGWSDNGTNYYGYNYSISGPGCYRYDLGVRTARYIGIKMAVRAPYMNNYSFWEMEAYRTATAFNQEDGMPVFLDESTAENLTDISPEGEIEEAILPEVEESDQTQYYLPLVNR